MCLFLCTVMGFGFKNIVRSRAGRAYAGIRDGESGAGSPEASDFLDSEALEEVPLDDGGQGGIRTHGTVSGTHAFQACPFDHSGTCPDVQS